MVYFQPAFTGSLEPHRYAALFPPMRPSELDDLCQAIAAHGQQVPGVVLGGKLLDGRNRDHACDVLGIPLRVISYTGSDAQALTYVLDANQHRRDLSTGQRGAVGATLMPIFAKGVAAERIEKLRELRLSVLAGKVRLNLAEPCLDPNPLVRTRNLAARCVGVSPAYVASAGRTGPYLRFSPGLSQHNSTAPQPHTARSTAVTSV